MSQKHHLRDLALSETGFVFDPYTGATFTTNATGRCVLEALREDLSRAEIAERLRTRFAPSADGPGDLDNDISEFIHLLRQHGVVPDTFTV